MKPTYLRDHGHEVLNPALPDDDFDAAVRIAQAEFDRHQPDVVVGSSRGGAVAMNIKADVPLVLLCSAWKRWGTATTVKPGTIILHSQADETIPFADSEEPLNSGLPESALVVVGHEHRLANEAVENIAPCQGNDTAKASRTSIFSGPFPVLDGVTSWWRTRVSTGADWPSPRRYPSTKAQMSSNDKRRLYNLISRVASPTRVKVVMASLWRQLMIIAHTTPLDQDAPHEASSGTTGISSP